MKRLVLLRRASQFAFLALFIFTLFSASLSPFKKFFPPGTFFKFDPLVAIATSLSERVIAPGLYLSLGMLTLTLVFGRFFCGWMCPLGAVIDAVWFFKKKLGMKKDLKEKVTAGYKYYILAFVIIVALFGDRFMLVLDPNVIMMNFVLLNLAPANTLMILFTLGSTLAARRFWCRSLCPLGALYAIIAGFAPLKRIVGEACRASCKECAGKCRMAAIKDDLSYVQSECILCMDCIYDCPVHATRFRFVGSCHYKP